jgi:integrase/DNA-binding transcriptional regulator YhcF (GntR family)
MPARTERARGSIERLPSGALRVKAYAGYDPVTKRRHYLTETIPAGPSAERQARVARDRMLAEIAGRRNPRTKATVDQLVERYLEQFDGADSTLRLYRGYVRNHISPFLGRLKIGALDADVLDSFYADLRRCRAHCTGRPPFDHRTKGEHECDERCGPHKCRPLNASTIRHMHFLLSGAYKRAVRWRWVSVSPIAQAEPPSAPKPNPSPPSPEEAARIVNRAWRDPDWGTLLWLAMTTGARRGELCALRWNAVSLDEGRETVWLRRAIRLGDDGSVEGDLKTHQQRRVALDPETAFLLRDHRDRCVARAEAAGEVLRPDAYVFSGAADGRSFLRPLGVTQRYNRMVARLGIDTTFHMLRHYTATELIISGVDVRTVAGRLGHSGGGTTTLRTYTAWVSEADQRAASGIGARMPSRPDPTRLVPEHEPAYLKIAVELRRRILAGELRNGQAPPAERKVASEFGVAVSTAHRSLGELRSWGLVEMVDGRRRVLRPASELTQSAPTEPSAALGSAPEAAGGRFWSVVLRGPDGQRYPPRLVSANLADPLSFRPHLVGIARVEDPGRTDDAENWVGNYELEVYEPGREQPVLTMRY